MPTVLEPALSKAPTEPPHTLVLLCRDLETSVPGLGPSAEVSLGGTFGSNVTISFVGDLCRNPGSIAGAVRDSKVSRLVLGLCSQTLSTTEVQL